MTRVALTGGAEWPRDHPKCRAASLGAGRPLRDGFPWVPQNKRVAGDDEGARRAQGYDQAAKGKHVIVIGGGRYPGSDCRSARRIGTALPPSPSSR